MTEVMGEAASGADKRKQVLLEARRRDSEEKRARVRKTVEKMLLAGDRVSFAAVARQAKVSSWLVYADGVREHIQTAMHQQAEQLQESRDDNVASLASLRTDLALARDEITRLRGEHERLRKNGQRLLGRQLDQVNVDDLHRRIDGLVGENYRLAEELQQSASENATMQARVCELEDDVTAARTALRRMIREHTAEVTASTDVAAAQSNHDPTASRVADSLERQALIGEGLEPDDPAVMAAMDSIRWELACLVDHFLNREPVRSEAMP